jgi:hypothetical protein
MGSQGAAQTSQPSWVSWLVGTPYWLCGTCLIEAATLHTRVLARCHQAARRVAHQLLLPRLAVASGMQQWGHQLTPQTTMCACPHHLTTTLLLRRAGWLFWRRCCCTGCGTVRLAAAACRQSQLVLGPPHFPTHRSRRPCHNGCFNRIITSAAKACLPPSAYLWYGSTQQGLL